MKSGLFYEILTFTAVNIVRLLITQFKIICFFHLKGVWIIEHLDYKGSDYQSYALVNS